MIDPVVYNPTANELRGIILEQRTQMSLSFASCVQDVSLIAKAKLKKALSQPWQPPDILKQKSLFQSLQAILHLAVLTGGQCYKTIFAVLSVSKKGLTKM